MQIWHFCRSPVDPFGIERGGVSNVVAILAREIGKIGIPTTVVCSDQDLGQTTAQAGKRNDGNLTVYTIAQNRDLMSGPMRELRAIVESMPPDAVAHVHGCFSAFAEMSMIYLARRNIPFVFSPHGKLTPGMLRKRGAVKKLWWLAIGRRAVSRATTIGIFSSQEGKFLRDLGLPNVHAVIPNGYSPPPPSAFTDPPLLDKPYVLFLGYLDPRKQPDLLIKSFALSHAQSTHKLVFVGPDAYGYQDKLVELAKSVSVLGRLEFAGPLHGVAKWNALRHAACICLPSQAEGMPLVLIEALGAQTPMVFSANCNASEISQHGAGVEIDSQDPQVWADAIDKVIEDKDLRQRSRERAAEIRSNYEWCTIARKWLQLYRNLPQ
jgi:glycosyltransferase involved in cell wall biosynthesis